jgi:DNA-binding GntR family transcriptional regulator
MSDDFTSGHVIPEDRAMAVQVLPVGRATAEEVIRAQATAARVACERMTVLARQAVRNSVERASCLPSRPAWERKAAAHAEIFHLLANAAGSPAATDPQGSQVCFIWDMMRMVGPVANGMISGSRQRLLTCLDTGNTDGAAQEMENHLRTLHFMAMLVPRH